VRQAVSSGLAAAFVRRGTRPTQTKDQTKGSLPRCNTQQAALFSADGTEEEIKGEGGHVMSERSPTELLRKEN